MTYTICKNVIKTACDPSESSNLIMSIAIDKTCKVAFTQKVLDDYNEYFSKEIIRTWFKLMDMNNSWKKVEIIREEEEFYVKVCLCTYDKRLVVNEKEDYLMCNLSEVNIFDINEASELIANKHIINVIGDGTTFTTGPNSSISQVEAV